MLFTVKQLKSTLNEFPENAQVALATTNTGKQVKSWQATEYDEKLNLLVLIPMTGKSINVPEYHI